MSIERLLQRRKDSREQLTRELAAERGAQGGRPAVPGLALAIGTRVFDRVTGEEVEVVGGASENIVVPTPGQ